MTDSTRVSVGRTMSGIGLVTGLIGLPWLVVLGQGGFLWENWVVHNALVAVAAGLIVWLAIADQPRNTAIWVLAWASILAGLEVVSWVVLFQSAEALGIGIDISGLDLVPADLPLWLALVAMQANWLWVGVLLVLGTTYVFPDGKTLSPVFRWMFRAFLVAVGLTGVGLFWEARPSSTLSLLETQNTNGGFRSLTAAMVTLNYPISFFLGLGGVVTAVIRYRKSSGLERQQFRWLVWGAVVAVLGALAALLFEEVAGRLDIALLMGALAFLALLGSIGVAIGKYRLYDIDVVISRTFVYGALAAFITAVYVGIVVGAGVLLGSADEANTWLGIIATVVIAIAFQPLRRALQRVANRIVYGRRATPYEVLSSFAQGISVVDVEVLTEMARSLVDGTTAEAAGIWMHREEHEQLLASWPAEVGDRKGRQPRSAEIVHEGDRLGRVSLHIDPALPFPETDKTLLDQVASGLGLALRNLLLTEDLRDRVEQLDASRRRIVAVQDETRRKLERDLHDGAQQRLVALKIKLGIGSSLAEKAGLDDVKSMIEVVKRETDQTIEAVRDFARGIYPPLLEAEGLEAALAAPARGLPIPVSIQAKDVARYPKDVEATVYFCVLEALQNASKHSEAKSVQVRLTGSEETLEFEVADDGVGFDPDAVVANGLVNMRDRVEALGGSMRVESHDGSGTLVRGAIPLLELVPR